MKRILLLVTVILFFLNNIFGQEVISTAGKTQSNSGYEVSWTLGEPVIKTFSAGNSILTQGFHQSKLIITAIGEISEQNNLISVFPNPTNEFAIVKFNTLPERNKYKLFD